MEREETNKMFFEQNLVDFSHKIHKVFLAGYKDFETITLEKFKQIDKNSSFYNTSVDFKHGEEHILSNNDLKSFSVTYSTNDDYDIATGLQIEITNRILSVLPRGFKQRKILTDNNSKIEIKFDKSTEAKANLQPTVEVIFDYATNVIEVIVLEPLKK